MDYTYYVVLSYGIIKFDNKLKKVVRRIGPIPAFKWGGAREIFLRIPSGRGQSESGTPKLDAKLSMTCSKLRAILQFFNRQITVNCWKRRV
jgi:hypothetical protein